MSCVPGRGSAWLSSAEIRYLRLYCDGQAASRCFGPEGYCFAFEAGRFDLSSCRILASCRPSVVSLFALSCFEMRNLGSDLQHVEPEFAVPVSPYTLSTGTSSDHRSLTSSFMY